MRIAKFFFVGLRLELIAIITGCLMTFGSAVATTLSWQELGGADYYGAHAPYLSRSPHLWFSPVEVGRLQNIQTEMLFTANVGTQNSDFYL